MGSGLSGKTLRPVRPVFDVEMTPVAGRSRNPWSQPSVLVAGENSRLARSSQGESLIGRQSSSLGFGLADRLGCQTDFRSFEVRTAWAVLRVGHHDSLLVEQLISGCGQGNRGLRVSVGGYDRRKTNQQSADARKAAQVLIRGD